MSKPIDTTPPLPRRWRHLALVALLAVGATLAGCGGETRDPFQPARLHVFGDEASRLEGDGQRHGINGLTSGGAIDCSARPIWVQSVAASTGRVFAECNPGGAAPTAFMNATVNARVVHVEAALYAYRSADARPGDLITVAVGLHDVLDVLAAGGSADAQAAALDARGRQLAAAVNATVRIDGPVALLATVPDVGRTPFALTQPAGGAALLTRLSESFNSGLRRGIVNDGRRIGLVDAYNLVQVMAQRPADFGLADATQAACNANVAPLPDCTTTTLVVGATADTWLWADSVRPAPAAGRPVRMTYDRHEDIVATTKRHSAVVRHRTGVAASGRLVAQEVDIVMDAGAYATLSPVVLSRGTLHATGPYRCPNVRVRARAAMTNTVPAGAFRGFGAPQTEFAAEVHLARIAEAVGVSSAELRRRLAYREGDVTATGQVLRGSVAAVDVLERAEEASRFEEERERTGHGRVRPGDRTASGVGLALGWHGAGFTGSGEKMLASRAGIELRTISASGWTRPPRHRRPSLLGRHGRQLNRRCPGRTGRWKTGSPYPRAP